MTLLMKNFRNQDSCESHKKLDSPTIIRHARKNRGVLSCSNGNTCILQLMNGVTRLIFTCPHRNVTAEKCFLKKLIKYDP